MRLTKLETSKCGWKRKIEWCFFQQQVTYIKQNQNSKIKNRNKENTYIYITWNYAKAVPFILNQPGLLIFLFCECSSGIELTNFKWFVKRCRRRQGSPQSRKFWGFMNCFCHVFSDLLNPKISSTLKHAVVNNDKF